MVDSATIRRDVAALVPEVRERADEVAALRRLPHDLVTSLKRSGAFRMPMPRSWGGPEMSLREQNEVVETLSAADPSVGWCVMIGSDAGFYSAFMDDDAGREIWPDLDMATAGWMFPAGRAVPVAGGYRISGRWAFGSGCTHADVIAGGCLVVDDAGTMITGDGGHVRVLAACAPAGSFEIIDTWRTTGLAGSGSNDYTCTDLFVPERHTFWFTGGSRRQGPLYRFPGAFFANMQGVPLGLARRAIDEAVGIARTRVLLPQHVHMRDVPRVREAVAEAEMLLRSTRSYVYDSIDAAWARWEAGEDATPRERADLALARVQAFRTAKQIALAMVQLAGTQAIYSTSILDRLVRDAITINQHIVVSPVFVESVGALLLDVEPDGLMSILV
jgi:alkylation response protein AidB-like acyl-CoA dehydrogenase